MAEQKQKLDLATLAAVVQGNGLFTRNTYKILAEEKNKNIFFSPISIHAILSLAAQASKSSTLEALTKVLQVANLEILAKGYHEVLRKLNSIEEVCLLMANKVYLKENYELLDTFKEVVVEKFFSEVENIQFEKKEEAANTINAWVEQKTNNKIQNLVSADDFDKYTRLVLVNAIYFKGKWAEPFKPELTKTEKFYLNETDTIDVQMMHIKHKFFYKNDEQLDAKVLELPYTNRDLSLIVILPNKRNGISDLEAKLAKTDLTRITEGMYRPDVIVALPKFKIETTINLVDPLKKLGLDVIFSDEADFSGMLNSPEQLQVSKVIHKAFIEVNEEGAEAAAATGEIMTMMRCAIHEEPPVEFIADHPFLIRLQPTEAVQPLVLFKGRVNNPLNASE